MAKKFFRFKGLTTAEQDEIKVELGIGVGTLMLGESSTTAYRGDRGKTAYDHSQITSGNPHGMTKLDVGLGNVDNTSDINKPVSTATQTAINNAVAGLYDDISNIDGGFPDSIAVLDYDGGEIQ